MAVEAGHLNLFPPQLITNRNLLNSNAGNAGTYNTQMGFGMPFTGTLQESLLPFPQSLVCDSVPVKTSVKAESGVTYNVPVAPRKRSRDSFNQISNFTVPQENNNNNLSELSSLLGRDIPLQIHQQQLEIDHIVAEHTKKIRVELEEKQKQHARLLVSAIGEGVMKKMKEKDEQIQRMGKLNWVLQERVKSLYVENQLWRDLAQTNEAAANSLRSHLEQVLAHVSDDRPSIVGCGGGAAAEEEEDAESCCGSNDYGRDGEEVEVVGRRMLAVEGGDKVAVGGSSAGGGGEKRLCKKCGERESCVLVLPCRHLCLCTPCGSKYHHTCPVCNSYMNASVNVNLS